MSQPLADSLLHGGPSGPALRVGRGEAVRKGTMKFTLATLIGVALLALLAGCGNRSSKFMSNSNRTYFQGNFYPAKVTPADEDPAVFTAVVSKASQNLAGAREAGEWEATRYCIRQFGNSDKTWQAGPETAQLQPGDDLILSGTCVGWQ
ncbi:hypothetical protein [Maritimibacter alkaliphilus]|uniref:hypothetical protein n=1 Tax=Maritimibacter alkaliphilus TaxID=404236 RepID=UPI001C980FD8|nr:hypothetical protein [Maritimibacter alkaliphilus]MBY6090140.1 hypothetical protein [Maritimibacter alkaliphilus]